MLSKEFCPWQIDSLRNFGVLQDSYWYYLNQDDVHSVSIRNRLNIKYCKMFILKSNNFHFVCIRYITYFHELEFSLTEHSVACSTLLSGGPLEAVLDVTEVDDESLKLLAIWLFKLLIPEELEEARSWDTVVPLWLTPTKDFIVRKLILLGT